MAAAGFTGVVGFTAAASTAADFTAVASTAVASTAGRWLPRRRISCRQFHGGFHRGFYPGAAVGLGLGLGYGLGYPWGWDGYPSDYGDYGYGGSYAGAQNWYYCANPAGYYPYVTQCYGPWQVVPAS